VDNLKDLVLAHQEPELTFLYQRQERHANGILLTELAEFGEHLKRESCKESD